MATLQELEAALINADKAGDGAAATILAKEISIARRRGALNSAPTVESATGVGGTSPAPVERFGRGMMDVADTVKRGYLGVADPERGKQFQKETDAEIARYEKDRGPGAGLDLMRIAGTTALTLPATATMGFAAAPVSLGGRALLGAAQGATQGALAWTPEGQSKTKQVALGAGAGALAPLLSDAVSAVTARIGQFGKAQAMKLAADPHKIIAELAPVLERQGVKWGDLAEGVRRGMIQQARQQLSVDDAVSPEAIARKVEMESLLGPGAGPTRGQVTRNPQDWTWERNSQKLPGELGAPITERFQAQLQRLREVAEDAIKRTQGAAGNEYQAGVSATGAITSKFEKSKAAVDDLYRAFRESGAGGTEVKPQGIADALGKVTEEYGSEHIPGAVSSRLKEFGLMGEKQTKLLTVDEAEKLRKLIGNNIDPRNRPQMAALMILKDSIDDSVKATEGPASKLLDTARGGAAARFAERDASGAVKAAVDGMEPDKFFQKFVVNGTVRDLQGLKATLTTGVNGDEAIGGQAWNDLRGQVLERAFSKAASQGEGTFSGKAFRKALGEIGDERLKILFDPAELADLKKLDRVAHGITAEPPLSAVNHSNTAPTGAQYMRDMQRAAPRVMEAATNIPFVGKVVAGAWNAGDEMARNAEMRRRVGQALLGDAFSPDAAMDKRQALARLLADRVDPIAATGAAATANYFTR